jgi:hypothetical protein
MPASQPGEQPGTDLVLEFLFPVIEILNFVV